MSIGEIRGEGMTVTGTTDSGDRGGRGGSAASRAIVRNVDVRARAGEIVGLAGPSGSGKTTLLYALGGLIPLDGGELLIDGRRAVPWKDASTAIVFQNLCLAPVLSAQETVGLPLQARGLPRAEVAARSITVLEALGLGEHTAQLVGALSGGQRQRVAIARALAAGADLILADEPTSALDEHWRDIVLDLLVREASQGTPVVIAASDPAVLAICHSQLTLTVR